MKIPTDDALKKGFVKRKLFPAIILLVVFIIFIGLFVIIAYKWNDNIDSEKETDLDNEEKTNEINENLVRCLELGCSGNSIYVGSVNSDKYYLCTCHYANRINSENIICFSSKEEAEDKGYVFVDCQ